MKTTNETQCREQKEKLIQELEQRNAEIRQRLKILNRNNQQNTETGLLK